MVNDWVLHFLALFVVVVVVVIVITVFFFKYLYCSFHAHKELCKVKAEKGKKKSINLGKF